MRQRTMLFVSLFVLAFSIGGCKTKSLDKEPSSGIEVTAGDQGSGSDTEVNIDTDVSMEDDDSELPEEPVTEQPTPVATKEDEKKPDLKGKGTFEGFIDSDMIQIEMAEGAYQPFVIKNNTVKQKLKRTKKGKKIKFQYKYLARQSNMQIVAVDE